MPAGRRSRTGDAGLRETQARLDAGVVWFEPALGPGDEQHHGEAR